jgi:hypothetical protein
VKIVPRRGTEEATFGQTAADVHAVIGHPARRVRNIEQTSSGWNLHYDEDDRLEFLESWSPDAVAEIDGFNLVGASAEQACDVLRRLGARPIDALGDGTTFAADLGVGLTGDPVDSVCLFPPGYYAAHGIDGID